MSEDPVVKALTSAVSEVFQEGAIVTAFVFVAEVQFAANDGVVYVSRVADTQTVATTRGLLSIASEGKSARLQS